MRETAAVALGGRSTGIGSLPHHNIDAALEFAFGFDIPFLPQIPKRNPWEYSVPQGLSGLPGLNVQPDGQVEIDVAVWDSQVGALDSRLKVAFESAETPAAFEGFEPQASSAVGWNPFLWELQERRVQLAKIQTVGPVTAQWSLGPLAEASAPTVFRWLLARSLAMVRRLNALGVRPVIFLDEPMLFALSPQQPAHLMHVQHLRLMIEALRKERAWVGLHCCSNADWEALIALPLDILSFDAALSTHSVLKCPGISAFVDRGGCLALGIVPTTEPQSRDSIEPLVREVRSSLQGSFPQYAKSLDKEVMWTPACGLANHTPEDAEFVRGQLLSLFRGGL